MAAVAFTELFHPDTVPSIVQNMKLAFFPAATGKPVAVFAMMPVTNPPLGAEAVGTATTVDDGVPMVL
jgi:hypothetical protein